MTANSSELPHEKTAKELLLLVDDLASCIDQFKQLVAAGEPGRMSRPASMEVTTERGAAEGLYAERLQLIEAWKTLEAEQRRQAIDVKSNGVGQIQAKSVQTQAEQRQKKKNNMDFAQQFRLLQRECDRRRNAE